MSDNYHISLHAQDQARQKQIPLWKILSVLENPVEHYPSVNHPGQWRYTGMGICVVVDDDERVVITVYLDRVLTPLRPDQIARGEQIRRCK